MEGTLAIAGGQKHKLPGKPLSLLTNSLLGFPAKLEAARVLTELSKLDATKFHRLTVCEWLDSEIRNEELRQLLQALFRLGTYGNDSERLSARLALSQVQMARKEFVLYHDGGWQTLVNDLRIKAEQAGVKITAESRVAKINQANGRVAGVNLVDGTSLTADAAIIATGPHGACEVLESGTHAAFPHWMKQAIPVKAPCLDIALEQLPLP